MIVRIVKLSFKVEHIDAFKQILKETKKNIRAFPGNLYLEILQGKEEHIFFTYSHWNEEADLENYRKSDLFKTTWAKTKPLFDAPAEAWTTNRIHQQP